MILISLSSIFILTGCSNEGGRMLVRNEPKAHSQIKQVITGIKDKGRRMFVSNEEQKADARIKQILAAIKDKDSKNLKALFSEQALNERNDFDSGIDYIFSFFQGKVTCWKRDKWASNESIRNGKKSIMLRSWYTVSTNKNKYLFFVIDFTEDTINPNNSGIYTLRIIKAKDKKTQFGYWQDMKIAGIYKPK